MGSESRETDPRNEFPDSHIRTQNSERASSSLWPVAGGRVMPMEERFRFEFHLTDHWDFQRAGCSILVSSILLCDPNNIQPTTGKEEGKGEEFQAPILESRCPCPNHAITWPSATPEINGPRFLALRMHTHAPVVSHFAKASTRAQLPPRVSASIWRTPSPARAPVCYTILRAWHEHRRSGFGRQCPIV